MMYANVILKRCRPTTGISMRNRFSSAAGAAAATTTAVHVKGISKGTSSSIIMGNHWMDNHVIVSSSSSSRRNYSSTGITSQRREQQQQQPPKRGGDVSYEGVSQDVTDLINKHASQPQTSVSLQALMRTGRGEYLHKTFEDIHLQQNMVDQHTATELVLIQVNFQKKREKNYPPLSFLFLSILFFLFFITLTLFLFFISFIRLFLPPPPFFKFPCCRWQAFYVVNCLYG